MDDDPIMVPIHWQDVRVEDTRKILDKLNESSDDLKRQGQFLFDETSSKYYDADGSSLTEKDRRIISHMRSRWIAAQKKSLNRFVITKHWDSDFNLVEEPMWIVRNEGGCFTKQETTHWLLFRRRNYNGHIGPFQVKIKGFIQEFCLKLRRQFQAALPPWFHIFWNGYLITKHFAFDLPQKKQDELCSQIFSMILYLLEYHNIDLCSIDAFADIERPERMIPKDRSGDIWLYLPRFLLLNCQHGQTNLEQLYYGFNEGLICGQWNLKETETCSKSIRTAFKQVRI
ncbi:hypothetical protein GEMRC1_002543 [Eukaryota sp. GEM-RC1]